jgi:YHS domain-containing protein
MKEQIGFCPNDMNEGLEGNMMKDPICGMMVDEKKTKLKSDHEGQAFYFCSASCKQKFDSDPHKYGHPE